MNRHVLSGTPLSSLTLSKILRIVSLPMGAVLGFSAVSFASPPRLAHQALTLASASFLFWLKAWRHSLFSEGSTPSQASSASKTHGDRKVFRSSSFGWNSTPYFSSSARSMASISDSPLSSTSSVAVRPSTSIRSRRSFPTAFSHRETYMAMTSGAVRCKQAGSSAPSMPSLAPPFPPRWATPATCTWFPCPSAAAAFTFWPALRFSFPSPPSLP
mmetsp:Transcript_278/g.660  ORF Transcript_278/g.660 Transcript_278/m.660 type:complete len:215 (-) Transcript_278:190-834(-)